MQLRMIVVEDETAILQGLMAMIGRMKLPLEIVGGFYDGQSALDSLPVTQPDIILTDVQMPGMTGLELIGRVRKTGWEAEYLILSGYSDFPYVRDALRLSVHNYLLKPPSIGELQESLAHLCEKVRGDRRDSMGRALRSVLLRQDGAEVRRLAEVSLRLMTWAWGAVLDLPVDKAIPDKCVTAEDVICALHEAGLPTEDVWALDGGAVSAGHVVVLEDADAPGIHAVTDAVAQYAKAHGVPLTLAVTAAPMAVSQLPDGAARHMAWIRQGASFGGVRVLTEPCAEPVQRQFTYGERDRLLRSMDRSGETIAQVAAMMARWHQAGACQQDYLEAARFVLPEMMRRAGQLDPAQCEADALWETAELAMASRDDEDFAMRLEQRLQALADQAEHGQWELTDVVRLLRETIEKDYCTQLDFNAFAARYGYHPIYLTGQFSHMQGISPKKLMIRLRMEKACELLRTARMTIGDVAQYVGYPDIAYFSRVFKEYAGVSPREYSRAAAPNSDREP